MTLAMSIVACHIWKYICFTVHCVRKNIWIAFPRMQYWSKRLSSSLLSGVWISCSWYDQHQNTIQTTPIPWCRSAASTERHDVQYLVNLGLTAPFSKSMGFLLHEEAKKMNAWIRFSLKSWSTFALYKQKNIGEIPRATRIRYQKCSLNVHPQTKHKQDSPSLLHKIHGTRNKNPYISPPGEGLSTVLLDSEKIIPTPREMYPCRVCQNKGIFLGVPYPRTASAAHLSTK